MLVNLTEVKQEPSVKKEGWKKVALEGLRIVIANDTKAARKALEEKGYNPIDYADWIEKVVPSTDSKNAKEVERRRDLHLRGMAHTNELGNNVVLVDNKQDGLSVKTAIPAAKMVGYFISKDEFYSK